MTPASIRFRPPPSDAAARQPRSCVSSSTADYARRRARTVSATWASLVDAGAVLKLVRAPDQDALSLRSAARTIGTSDPALEALIAGGHIAAFIGVNAVNRCPQTLVANKELKHFKANYVSLWTLSNERGMYIATLKSKLDRAGIEPAFHPAAIGARFYARRDLDN
jgi:hypothetical protein